MAGTPAAAAVAVAKSRSRRAASRCHALPRRRDVNVDCRMQRRWTHASNCRSSGRNGMSLMQSFMSLPFIVHAAMTAKFAHLQLFHQTPIGKRIGTTPGCPAHNVEPNTLHHPALILSTRRSAALRQHDSSERGAAFTHTKSTSGRHFGAARRQHHFGAPTAYRPRHRSEGAAAACDSARSSEAMHTPTATGRRNGAVQPPVGAIIRGACVVHAPGCPAAPK